MTEEERAIICAVRKATGFPLDDLTFVLRHFLPYLNRDSNYRVLKAEGLNRRPPKSTVQPSRGQGRFYDYDLWFISTSNICPSCAPLMAKYVSASSM
jgi:hypothetical protein